MSTWTKVIFIKFSQLFTIHVHSDSTFLPSGKCRLKFAWFTCSFKKYVFDFWYILSSFQLWAASYVSTTVLFANISFLFNIHTSFKSGHNFCDFCHSKPLLVAYVFENNPAVLHWNPDTYAFMSAIFCLWILMGFDKRPEKTWQL